MQSRLRRKIQLQDLTVLSLFFCGSFIVELRTYNTDFYSRFSMPEENKYAQSQKKLSCVRRVFASVREFLPKAL